MKKLFYTLTPILLLLALWGHFLGSSVLYMITCTVVMVLLMLHVTGVTGVLLSIFKRYFK